MGGVHLCTSEVGTRVSEQTRANGKTVVNNVTPASLVPPGTFVSAQKHAQTHTMYAPRCSKSDTDLNIGLLSSPGYKVSHRTFNSTLATPAVVNAVKGRTPAAFGVILMSDLELHN